MSFSDNATTCLWRATEQSDDFVLNFVIFGALKMNLLFPFTFRIVIFGTKTLLFVLEIFCGCVPAGGNRSRCSLLVISVDKIASSLRCRLLSMQCGWPTKASRRWKFIIKSRIEKMNRKVIQSRVNRVGALFQCLELKLPTFRSFSCCNVGVSNNLEAKTMHFQSTDRFSGTGKEWGSKVWTN